MPDQALDDDALRVVLEAGRWRDPAAQGPAEILEVSQICGNSLHDVRYFRRGTSVRVGAGLRKRWLGESGWKHPFQVPDALLPSPDHLLFEAGPTGWRLRAAPHWQGFVEYLGQGVQSPRQPLQHVGEQRDGLQQIPLPKDAQIVVDVGGTIFVARLVPESPQLHLEPVPLDPAFVVMALIFCILVATLGMLLYVVPSPLQLWQPSAPIPPLEATLLPPPPMAHPQEGLGYLGTQSTYLRRYAQEPTPGFAIEGQKIITGHLDKKQIDTVVHQNLGTIRYCYQQALQEHPSLQGKVIVQLVIAVDGSVASARTERSSLHNSEVEACINSRMMHLTFPAPQGKGLVILSYPLIFSTRDT